MKELEEFHLTKYTEDKAWSFRSTSESLNRSLGSISEDLRLSLGLRIYPMLAEFHTKEAALAWLRVKDKCRSYAYRDWSAEQVNDILTYLKEELKDA